jgi:hypothetical protein
VIRKSANVISCEEQPHRCGKNCVGASVHVSEVWLLSKVFKYENTLQGSLPRDGQAFCNMGPEVFRRTNLEERLCYIAD